MGNRFFNFNIFILLLFASFTFAQDPFPGTALNFDGMDDYVTIGNPANLNFPGTALFTIEAWVKPDVDNLTGSIFSKFNLTVAGDYTLSLTNGIPVAHREVSPYHVYATTTLLQNNWYFISTTYDGTNFKIYVNGIIEGEITSGSIAGSSSEVLIGAENHGGNPANFFKGIIDEVRIWNTALSETQIKERMRFTLDGTEAGLISYWQFNEGADTTLVDSIGGNNAIMNNMSDSSWVSSTIPINLITNIDAGLQGIYVGSTDWGDFDNDGDLDVLITGKPDLFTNDLVTKVYRNNVSIFTEISTSFTGIGQSDAEWGDYDNDNDLDILISGESSNGSIIRIYQNESGSFVEKDIGLTNAYDGSISWGDYDNDGDLDILSSGAIAYPGIDPTTKILRNEIGVNHERFFVDINANLPGVFESTVEWADYDNDGDLDFLLCGKNISGEIISHVYQSNYSADSGYFFQNIDAGLTGIHNGAAEWGDFDSDGDLDILLTGDTDTSLVTIIYRNDTSAVHGRKFVNIQADLKGLSDSFVSWGDYENDGDLDILLSGATGVLPGYLPSAHLYLNDSGIFAEYIIGLKPAAYGGVDWGDYDSDGDLDILIGGLVGLYPNYNTSCTIYRNNALVSNTIPDIPTGLNTISSIDSLVLLWNKSLDNETPQEGLSYNVIIGNDDNNFISKTAMSNVNSGQRLVTEIGNVGQIHHWTYYFPNYYSYPHAAQPNFWGVQAIDNSLGGSLFATDSFNIPISYLATFNNNIMHLSDTLKWQIQLKDSITIYELQIDDDSLFTNCEVHETLFVSISDSNFYKVHLQYLPGTHNLISGAKYYWRIKPHYSQRIPTVYTFPASSFWFEFISDIGDEQEIAIPKQFALYQNYPNPFNPTTTIKYALPKTSDVKIELYDMLGRKIKTLIDTNKNAGYHTCEFKPNKLASGVYIYRIQAGQFNTKKKLLLMK